MNLECSMSQELLKKLELLTQGGENFNDLIKLLPLPIVLHFICPL